MLIPRSPARHRRPRTLLEDRRLRRRLALVVAAATTVAVVLPGVAAAIAPSTASWTDREWDAGRLSTSALACGTDTDSTATSSSRFLTGTLAGTSVDSTADVEGVTVAKAGTAAATVDPVTAPALDTGGDTTVAAFGNPLQVNALGGLAGLDLTGLGTGLPAGSTGAVNQMATVSSTGATTAASGLVSNSGGVLVTDSTPSADLPEPASLDLTSALGPIANVTSPALDVGAVGSSAQLDGCDALEDQLWGTSSSSTVDETGAVVRPAALADEGTVVRAAATTTDPVRRDYGIASLDLRLRSPLAAALVPNIRTTVNGTISAVTGPSGSLVQGVVGIVGGLLGSLSLGSAQATIDTAPVTALINGLTGPLTDSTNTVSVDLSTGTVEVDLAHLLGHAQLDDLPPNTEIVLDPTLLAAVSVDVTTLLTDWVRRVATMIVTTVQASSLTLSVTLQVLGSRLTIALPSGATVGGAAANGGGVTLSGGVLGLVGGLLSSLTSGIVGSIERVLTKNLITPLQNLLTTAIPGSSTATTAATTITALGTALSSVTVLLPRVLSLRVNVQTTTGGGRRADGGATTPTYTETALRIGLVSNGQGADLAHLDLATSRVGPVSVTGSGLST
ncbi:choice-of-anchor G family protein [Curtobacterium sp. MCBD17_028]|uniref:choice-of-anchor G family protein n=1 Tax=Curtobacterium sp. MCBD17_028 TaxID=2175670 RepID=UPI000DA775AB|nr:choice-of-anchor G family protein [Curtobacterium sp. MCBD17_028]PZE27914.1 hypothetical protein DEI86_04775 [Curtobacterium sp. MCBD17_028]